MLQRSRFSFDRELSFVAFRFYPSSHVFLTRLLTSIAGDNRTPLFYLASQRTNTEAFNLLLEAGADLKFTNPVCFCVLCVDS